ncbi:MAG: BadF/BadG/BcrA/BcrD ATPase family protein [Chloroflexota bacterium]
MTFFLGVDGGGTCTRAILVDELGQVHGYGLAGPSNYDDIGQTQAQLNIAAAVTEAWQQIGQPIQRSEAAFLGMAGVVSEADRDVIRAIAANLDLAPSDAVGVDHDIRIALAGGLSGRPGIALIAGTGSACYGRNVNGESWRSGGWGQLIGDEGSAYWLGVQAMRSIVRAYDGRGRQTNLQDAVLAQLDINDIDDIMHRLYGRGLSRSEIASLAPLVVVAAEEGDRVAQQLLDRAASDLAGCVTAVIEKLNLSDSSELVLIGGLLTNARAIRDRLETELARCSPTCRIVPTEMPPVLGAALLAIMRHEPNPSPKVPAAMKESVNRLPQPEEG